MRLTKSSWIALCVVSSVLFSVSAIFYGSITGYGILATEGMTTLFDFLLLIFVSIFILSIGSLFVITKNQARIKEELASFGADVPNISFDKLSVF